MFIVFVKWIVGENNWMEISNCQTPTVQYHAFLLGLIKTAPELIYIEDSISHIFAFYLFVTNKK